MVRTSAAAIVRNLSVWVVEFLKLVGQRRLHPVNAECPICQQMVRLHYKKAGRRHVLAHARAYSRALYKGSRYAVHYTAKLRCLGSGTPAKFDPRPNENQYFRFLASLLVLRIFGDLMLALRALVDAACRSPGGPGKCESATSARRIEDMLEKRPFRPLLLCW
jgi:hypothetical protein